MAADGTKAVKHSERLAKNAKELGTMKLKENQIMTGY